MTARHALVVGVGGQDGAYLARHLLALGQRVTGTSRHAAVPANLARLGIADDVALLAIDPGDRAAVERMIREVGADDIYWLAAQTAVAASFDDPGGGLVTAAGMAMALTTIRACAPATRLIFAASGECFGLTTREAPARETTAFAPRSPYAVGKCAAALAIAQGRAAYGQFACSAFLFNHESPLRPEQFVIAKVAAAVRRIAAGSHERLRLGDIEVVRDWGWAPEYVVALHAMLAADTARDLIVATGRSERLGDLVEEAFAAAGLDWRDHVDLDAMPPRPGDAPTHFADPALAAETLGWRATITSRALIRRLVLASDEVDFADRSGSHVARGAR